MRQFYRTAFRDDVLACRVLTRMRFAVARANSLPPHSLATVCGMSRSTRQLLVVVVASRQGSGGTVVGLELMFLRRFCFVFLRSLAHPCSLTTATALPHTQHKCFKCTGKKSSTFNYCEGCGGVSKASKVSAGSAAECNYKSARGHCNEAVQPSYQFCKHHLCPGCHAQKSSRAPKCAICV
jgi:hypothetical protein